MNIPLVGSGAREHTVALGMITVVKAATRLARRAII